jgi:hypothetical protein
MATGRRICRPTTFAELAASLSSLSRVYAEREYLRRACRDTVIEAKDRARWASRNQRAAELKRRIKAEMVEWMLVWLGDPALFDKWARRRQHMDPNLLSLGSMESMTEEREKCDVCGGTGQCTLCKGTGNGGQCFNCAGVGDCPQCQGTGRRPVH